MAEASFQAHNVHRGLCGCIFHEHDNNTQGWRRSLFQISFPSKATRVGRARTKRGINEYRATFSATRPRIKCSEADFGMDTVLFSSRKNPETSDRSSMEFNETCAQDLAPVTIRFSAPCLPSGKHRRTYNAITATPRRHKAIETSCPITGERCRVSGLRR